MADLTHYKLQERVKELTALHRTARLLQDETRQSIDIVREIVDLLPAAWQYPDITAARICFQDINEATPNFRDTPWLQSARFVTRGSEEGQIDVVYLETRPEEAEGPFLAEERDLIDSLADMLRAYFQHKIADAEIQTAHDQLEQLVLKRTDELRRINSQLEWEVAQHQEARQRIEEYQDRLRRLATELTLTEARERREIAADLHDHIIQEFAFIKLRILQFRGDAIFCGFDRNLDEIVSLLDGAIQHARELTFEISTPILYELGLPAALEWLAEQFTKRHGLPIELAITAPPDEMPETIRVTLFKCVQELLTNVVKYAQSPQAIIRLTTTDRQWVIEVIDRGVGFDVKHLESPTHAAHGFGLFSIRERLRHFGGEMIVDSVIGRGTIVRLIMRRSNLEQY